MRKTVLFVTVLALSATMSFTTLAGAWKQDTTGYSYQNDDGSYRVNQWFQDFNGKWYFFKEDGYMLTNAVAPDGRQVGADGAWIEPVVGETKKILPEINNWLVGDIWNKGFCDFGFYETDGTSSTGQGIDIEYSYQKFCENYKKKAGYDAYIMQLPDEYTNLKAVWEKLSPEADKLYKYYADNGVKERGNHADTGIFTQYMYDAMGYLQ